MDFIPKRYIQYWNCCTKTRGYSGTAVFTKVPPLSVKMGTDNPAQDCEG